MTKEEDLYFFRLKTQPYWSAIQNYKVTLIYELHHDRNEILVPTILYMDGIIINNSGQTTLTPLNLTLCIFNTLTRNSRLDAWETICFHPTGTRDTGGRLIDNVNNLHSGLPVALSSLKDAYNLMDGIKWSNFWCNKKKWSVQMKSAVTYFIGNTPQHDQLCGHYQTTNTKMICRHCNCPRAFGNNARANVLKVPVSIKSGKMKVSKDNNGEEHQYYKKQSPHSTTTGSEVQDIFTKYVIPEIGKLWSSPINLTADNFFNGDWMGGLGFGMIGIVAQNRLPKTVEDKYFHKENVSSASGKRRLRVARLCNPVTKDVPARAESDRFTKGHRHIHYSFQNTGACNIGFVNSLHLNDFFMHQKERGRGRGKRKWGIEMNHSQELYLQTYGKLDQIDSAISRSNIGYKSWKYYHAPIDHAKALAVLTAFDMYQELTDDKAYPVNMLLREVAQSSTKQRLAQSDPCRSCAYLFGGGILNYHCLETVFEVKLNGRFCLEFATEECKKHHKSLCISMWKSRRNCYMCSAGYYTVWDCFADYHLYKYFGFGRVDFSCRIRTNRKPKKDWEMWSTAEQAYCCFKLAVHLAQLAVAVVLRNVLSELSQRCKV
eukprot:jgi/Psemu1/23547/gm1.23547_g